MGKKKNKRFRAQLIQPTGLTVSKEEDANELETQSSPSIIADVLDQLQSVEEETRECGCGTLAVIASQPGALPLLLKANVIRILAPLVVDPSLCVRHRALGALRNFTVDGGEIVCQEMIQKDVLTPLIALFKQYGTGWEPEKGKMKHDDTRLGIFIEAVHVLWNLCETSDIAITCFNREGLMPLLLPCLQFSVYGFPLATAVAQCLYSITESNQDAIAYCQSADIRSLLQTLAQQVDSSSQALLFQAAVIGILINVMGEEMLTGSGLGVAVGTLTHILDINSSSLLAELFSRPQMNGVPDSGSGDQIDSREGLDVKQNDICMLLDAQQLCLALITNLCCSPDDDWEDIDSSESGSSDEVVGVMDVEDSEGNNNYGTLCVPSEVHAAFVASNIVAKVVYLSCPPPSELSQLKNYSARRILATKLTQVRTYALLCLNNLVDSMTTEALGGLSRLHDIWDMLVKQVNEPGQLGACTPSPSCNLDLLEAMTGAMRALVQKLAKLTSPKFSEVSSGDLHFLVKMAEGASIGVQVHVIRIVATIATLLSKTIPQHMVIQEVGGFLMTVASQSPDLVVVAEALDALFDVFSDDATDILAQQLHLVEHLSKILPQLKTKLQGQRKVLGENYVTVAMAKANLIRFIKYKQSAGK